jgi:predicted O-linked N-acetylglucosamine transferase (SPINDLY family)
VWAGVPLITRSGKTFASRVAGSILTTIGLPELIVEDDAAYEALALRVYNDRAYLADLKRRVEEGVQNGPLYNAELYARHFEQVLSAVYESHHKGAPPDDLMVPAFSV